VGYLGRTHTFASQTDSHILAPDKNFVLVANLIESERLSAHIVAVVDLVAEEACFACDLYEVGVNIRLRRDCWLLLDEFDAPVHSS